MTHSEAFTKEEVISAKQDITQARVLAAQLATAKGQ